MLYCCMFCSIKWSNLLFSPLSLFLYLSPLSPFLLTVPDCLIWTCPTIALVSSSRFKTITAWIIDLNLSLTHHLELLLQCQITIGKLDQWVILKEMLSLFVYVPKLCNFKLSYLSSWLYSFTNQQIGDTPGKHQAQCLAIMDATIHFNRWGDV